MSPGLKGCNTEGLADEAFTSYPIISLKQQPSGLKTTNCIINDDENEAGNEEQIIKI